MDKQEKINKGELCVDGVTKSGRGWAKEIGRTKSYINKYRAKHGDEKTVQYIRSVLSGEQVIQKRRKDVTTKYFTSGRIKDLDVQYIFRSMIYRCYYKEHDSYIYYGGKGINVCEEWREDPGLFESWAIEHGYTKGLSIDRIDSDQDYSPDNCRIVTKSVNSKWNGRAKHIEIDGVVDTCKGWSEKMGLNLSYVNDLDRVYGRPYTIKFIKSFLKNNRSFENSIYHKVQMLDESVANAYRNRLYSATCRDCGSAVKATLKDIQSTTSCRHIF